MTSGDTEPLDSRAGQAVYSRWTLRLYDLYVLGLSCRLAVIPAECGSRK